MRPAASCAMRYLQQHWYFRLLWGIRYIRMGYVYRTDVGKLYGSALLEGYGCMVISAAGLVPRFPTLISSGFLVLAALLSFFSGLILDTIAQKSRQEFEHRLQVADMAYKRMRKEE